MAIMENIVRLTVRLPRDLYDRLRRRAEETGKSLNQTIVEAIQMGLDNYSQEVKNVQIRL
jgi:predicted DNA-binding protein